MYNDILKIGPLTVKGYGLMIAIGFIVAIYVGEWLAKKKEIDDEQIFPMAVWCLAMGFLGAKVLYCIVDFHTLITTPQDVLMGNGFVVYGGIISGVLTGYVFCRKNKLYFLDYLDVVLPSVAITQAFGRIGCFLAGCCYGLRTDSAFGVTFHHSDFAPNDVKLIPTQLISSAGLFFIAFILIRYLLKSKRSGATGALYMILYSIGRFMIEFLRGDNRGEVAFLSTSQFISLFILCIGFVLLAKSGNNEKQVVKTNKEEKN
jgi:phosphatidylglycerol:prolipoprotein diacylglycerol transferase